MLKYPGAQKNMQQVCRESFMTISLFMSPSACGRHIVFCPVRPPVALRFHYYLTKRLPQRYFHRIKGQGNRCQKCEICYLLNISLNIYHRDFKFNVMIGGLHEFVSVHHRTIRFSTRLYISWACFGGQWVKGVGH